MKQYDDKKSSLIALIIVVAWGAFLLMMMLSKANELSKSTSNYSDIIVKDRL